MPREAKQGCWRQKDWTIGFQDVPRLILWHSGQSDYRLCQFSALHFSIKAAGAPLLGHFPYDFTPEAANFIVTNAAVFYNDHGEK